MNIQNSPLPISPRVVRSTPDPLGLYIRVGRNDHRALQDFIASGHPAYFGLVFEPTTLMRHRELREQVLAARFDAILDPKTQQSETPGRYNESLGSLPWGVGRPHTQSDFSGTSGRRLLNAIGDFVLEHGFTKVLAPTHLLRSASDDWLAVDVESIKRLRDYLDRRNGAEVPIIYSLAITYATFRDAEQRSELVRRLRTVPVSDLWLKVDGFGSDSSPAATLTYLEAITSFHDLGIPIIADHVGGLIGLSLLAFNATGGLAHGVTLGERFNTSDWRKPPRQDSFGPQRRVYVPQLDLQLKPGEAQILFDASPRMKALFGCRNNRCCQRGIKDMLENPSRHFLYQRTKEISDLSQIPSQFRAQRFLEHNVRPTTDRVLAATNMDWKDGKIAKKMGRRRKRLDRLRVVLGEFSNDRLSYTMALLPKTRVVREPVSTPLNVRPSIRETELTS